MSVLIALLAVTGAVAAPAARADVVLNEVNCDGTDWVELANTSAGPADIGGWILTDDPLDAADPATPRADHRMQFAAGTEIPGNAALVVERTTHFPFGISCDDRIRLGLPDETEVDATMIAQHTVATDTWGRYPNASGPFIQSRPTRGTANEPSPDGTDPPENPEAWLYDPSRVSEISLTAPQSSLDALEADPRSYQPATFAVSTEGGAYGPLQVGVRLKGGLEPTPLSGKAAFKLKFNHVVAGQRFLGLKKLTLNSMTSDPSMVRELLAYEVYRAAGLAAPRTGYAYVRLNGHDYGVYLNIEAPDDVFLDRWYTSSRHLYEGQYGNDVVHGGAAAFEIDEGDENDRTDLEALVEAANSTSADWSDQIAEEADLQQMTRMWAVEKYVGQIDGYASGGTHLHPNNYFLHSDGSGRFTMIPWGSDYAMSTPVDFDENGGVLFQSCLADPTCLPMYREALVSLPSLVDSLHLDALALETAAMLAPWQQIDPRSGHSMEVVGIAVDRTLGFLATRPAGLSAWLNPPPLDTPETEISKRYVNRAKRRVSIHFTSSDPDVRFECKVDRRAYAPCASPQRFRVGSGKHRFRVRAIGAPDLVDLTPAVVRFVMPAPRGGAAPSRR